MNLTNFQNQNRTNSNDVFLLILFPGYCPQIKGMYFVGYSANYNQSTSVSNGKLPLNARATVKCRSDLRLVKSSSVTCRFRNQHPDPTWVPLSSPYCQGNENS